MGVGGMKWVRKLREAEEVEDVHTVTPTHASTIKLVLRCDILKHIERAGVDNLRLLGCVLSPPAGVRLGMERNE